MGNLEQYRQVFVFGNQKSGTTAVAALLAKMSGCSSTLDIPPIWHNERALHDGTLALGDLVNEHPEYFNKCVIKEPCLTFLYDRLMPLFPNAAQVFVVRHPVENLRSILDRLETPGNLGNDIDAKLYERFGAWKEVIDGRFLDVRHDHYVERLAARWVRAAQFYLAHRDEMLLVRYEDFIQDKVGVVKALVYALELEVVQTIIEAQHFQYQPRGTNRGIDWKEFFGSGNLVRIRNIIAPYLETFDYRLEV